MPSKNEIIHTLSQCGRITPISLGYIASSLQEKGFNTKIVDLELFPRPGPQILQKIIKKYDPSIVGFSIYNENMHNVLCIAKICKEINRKILTIIGGPQATFMPEKALFEMPDIDLIVRGEGEQIMPLIVTHNLKGKSFYSIPGITFKKQGKIISTKKSVLMSDLDKLPSPYLNEVFDLDMYSEATLLSSRGCSYSCTFCYTPNAFNRKIRHHSVERVIKDIKKIYDEGINALWIADPAFTLDKNHANKILNAIIKNEWELSIWCETRLDAVDEELLDLMKKAGVYQIFYGLESSNQQTLDRIRKNLNFSKVENVIKWTKERGIKVELAFIVGLPYETKKEIEKTIEFARKLEPDYFAVQPLSLYFGTELYKKFDKCGFKEINTNRPSYMSIDVNYDTTWLTKAERDDIMTKIKELEQDLGLQRIEPVYNFMNFI
ncbi:MAG: B12-binding domain-containing radical SAM protein [Promethearchaeota archaeon]